MIREIVKIDEEKCDGCGLCVPACAEGAIQIIEGKAKLLAENLCDGLGACLGDCPRDAITIERRNADEYDEEVVNEHLKKIGRDPLPGHQQSHAPQGGGCPSAQVKQFPSAAHGGGCPSAQVKSHVAPTSGNDDEAGRRQSHLQQWPVQLHLVPPTAPFFQDADVVLAADCVPFAYPDFHKDFLKGKALAIACPKLDDTSPYLEKIKAMILQSNIKSLTVLHMEVPCCSGIIALAKRAIEESGRDIPLETVRIGIQGERK
ncbi:MAG: 4Fe-4S ferredoxin [Desulfuromonas sp.]|nr:MAG: 4Fe-4S ferredoxin [Desulfuromonas sp.]